MGRGIFIFKTCGLFIIIFCCRQAEWDDWQRLQTVSFLTCPTQLEEEEEEEEGVEGS